MTESHNNIDAHAFVDLGIATYLNMPQTEQVSKWTDENFVANFPSWVERILTPGSDDELPFSSEQRSQIFNSAVDALAKYKWAPLGKGQDDFIPFSGKIYNLTQKTFVGTNSLRQPTDVMEAPSYFAIGSLFLLGKSLDTSQMTEDPMDKMMHTLLGRNVPDSFKNDLAKLLYFDSPTRQWIKEKGLDTNIGIDWDEDFPHFFLLQPQYADGKFKEDLPYIFVDEDTLNPSSANYISPTTFVELMGYIVSLIAFKDPADRGLLAHDLKRVMTNVRRLPQEIQQQAHVGLMADYIQLTIEDVYNRTSQTQGAVVNARDMLQDYFVPGTKRKIRWFDVKKLKKRTGLLT